MSGRPSSMIIAGLLGLLLGAGESQAAPTPKQIVERAMKQQVFRIKGVQMRIDMLLKNKRGEKRQRSMSALSMRAGDQSKTRVRVDAPADVRGMGFLFLQKRDSPDDQFMYMPALRVAKRIVGSNKKASFLGSQFSYADLEWSSLEEAAYTKRADEKIGGDSCWVVEAKPKEKDSQYSALRLWVRKKDSAMLRLLYFDRHGKQLKVLFVKKIETIGGVRMATRMKMKNLQEGATTLLAIRDVKLRSDLKADQFTVRALKKQ